MRLLTKRRLRVALRVIAAALAAIIVLFVLALATYDVIYFQPHTDEINAVISTASPDDRALPPLVRDMVQATFQSKHSLCNTTARQLLLKFDLSEELGWKWILRYGLWSQLMCLHYSESENISIFSTLAYAGSEDRFGLSNGAQQRFRKRLGELSENEAAELMALTRSPFLMLRTPGSLEMETELILQRYYSRNPKN